MAREIWKPSQFLERDLRKNADFVGALEAIAHGIEARAKAIAPVGTEAEGDANPGAYRDSIHVRLTPGPQGTRVAVVADDFKAVWIEYGSVHNPAFAVLRKAARQSFGKGKHGLGSGTKTGRVRSTRKKK